MVAQTVTQLRYPLIADGIKRATTGIDFGKRYRAEKMPNGNFAIRDVEIFQACQRPNPATGAVDDFGQKFLETALSAFRERSSDQYLPPVHIGHHKGQTVANEFAGHLILKRVENDKKGIPTLYGDMVEIPPRAFAEIMANRLPYRSVEINNPASGEISSLALLSTEVPYFKFPLMRVEKVNFSASMPDTLCFSEDGFTPGGTGVCVTQRFSGEGAALTEPTQARQMFMGYGRQHYADGDDDEQMMDDGEDAGDPDIEELLANLSEPELAELLDQLGQDDGSGYDGQDDSMNPAAGDTSAMQGEDEMAGPIGEQILQSLGELTTAVQSLASSSPAANPAIPSPPPVSAHEPNAGAAHFSENGNGKMPLWAQAFVDRLTKMEKETAERNARMDQFFSEMEAEQKFAEMKAEQESRMNAVADDLAARKFDEGTIDAAWNAVAPRVADDLALVAGGQRKELTDPAVFFGEYLRGVPATQRSNLPTPPDVPAGADASTAANGGAAPGSKPPVVSEQAKAFAEKHGKKPKAAFDANPVMFSETYDKAIAEWKAEYENSPRAAMFGSMDAFIANRVKQLPTETN
jgi:hypothetical protein